jgi:hypothetical protein
MSLFHPMNLHHSINQNLVCPNQLTLSVRTNYTKSLFLIIFPATLIYLSHLPDATYSQTDGIDQVFNFSHKFLPDEPFFEVTVFVDRTEGSPLSLTEPTAWFLWTEHCSENDSYLITRALWFSRKIWTFIPFLHFMLHVWPSENFVEYEVSTAVTMKNDVFSNVVACGSYKSRCFGGKYRLHLQGRKCANSLPCSSLHPCSVQVFSSALCSQTP